MPILQFDKSGLSLVGNGLTFQGDFTRMLPRIQSGRLQGELLIRAAKPKNFARISSPAPVAIDATAGLGEDSFLLAAAGFSVCLLEYNPVIAALLQDALYRAAKIPELADIIRRMYAYEADSIKVLSQLKAPPDLILLDPMFPARQKSGLIKKKFQLLQCLEQPCVEEAALLQAAIDAHPAKIIIKRPAKGPYLAGMTPSYSICGKGIRYDCIIG